MQFRGHGARGRGRGRGRFGNEFRHNNPSGSTDPTHNFKRLCKFRDLGLEEMKDFVQAALLSLDAPGGEELVLAAFSDPRDMYAGARSHLVQILQSWSKSTSTTAQVYLDLIGPLLRMAAHKNLRDSLRSHHVNPFYSVLAQHLDLCKVASSLDSLQGFITQAMPQEPHQAPSGVVPATAQQTGAWRPSSWLCILEPPTTLMRELLERFQMDADFSCIKAGVGQLTEKVQQLLSRIQGTSPHTRELRLLQRDIDKINSLLGRGAAVANAIDQGLATAAQRRAQREANQSNAELRIVARIKDPMSAPGELRPSGPRHSNDHKSISRVRIVPTADELLCCEEPYLPFNRPGGIPHAESNPEAAHLELHFRLLREDAVAPLRAAIQKFRNRGGLAQLAETEKGPWRKQAAANRVQLGDTCLSVFRNVAFDHLDVTKADGLCLWVSFDQPASMANKSLRDLRESWEKSRRLATGSLVALWWEPEGPQEPRLELAVVANVPPADRIKHLASLEGRPTLCLRLVLGQPDFLLALMHASLRGIGKEIAMVQDFNSFFAYEPILKALQSMATIPLAHVLIAPQTGPPKVEVPAYMLGRKYDLSCLIDKDKLCRQLAPEEARRALKQLQEADMSGRDTFPTALLQMASNLDEAQAIACQDALLQEVAVMQGPPGTGKTFLGVKLLHVLLSNTCNKRHLLPQQDGFGPHNLDLDELVGGPEARAGGKADVGPILVVCFTNHALDSFLEDILSSGATESIVRVGGRSSSEMLKPFNLANLSMQATQRDKSGKRAR